MAINPEQISKITTEAFSVLKNKTLGGVTKESAQSAIESAVKKAVQLGEEAVGRVQQEIQALKGKTAREIADITSQKDAFVHQIEQKAAKEIAEVQQKAAEVQKKAAEAVKQARAPRTAERLLPNGHKEVRKVNQNGAVMVKEYNEAGQLLKSNVTALDGTIRRTSYNPVDGRPVKTFTNTSGKDMLIEYPANGNIKMTRVNNKKVKPQKPTLVSQTSPRAAVSNGWDENGITFDRIYSDGSKETITRFTSNNKVQSTISETYDANGKKIADKILFTENNHIREHIYKEGKTIAKEEYDLIKGREVVGKYKGYNETVFDPHTNKQVIIKAKRSMLGETATYKAIKDELGFYTGKYEVKTTYPKGSGKAPVVSVEDGANLPRVYKY